jgi:O-antigen/teichoic acid export membrane protein
MLVPEHLQGMTHRLFPAALTGLAFAGIAGVYQAALEGLQRYDRTNIVLVAGSVVHAGAALLFVPKFGTVGLGWAYTVQWAFVLAGMILAAGTGPGRLPVFPRTWSAAALRRLLGFGWKMQAMGVIAGVVDPLTKWTVTLVAGVGPTAYLDMGMRLLGIIRQVLVGAAATLVPAVATLADAGPERLAAAYARARDLMAALAPPLLLLPAALAPLVPDLWISRSEPRLETTILLCAPAFCVNALSAPSYFFLTATGRMNFPLSGHLITLLLVPSAGLLLGMLFGFGGAAAGAAIAMVAGSAMAFAGIRASFPLRKVNRSAHAAAALIYAGMITAGAAVLPSAAQTVGAAPAAVLGLLVFAAGAAVALRWSDGWRHMREIASTLVGDNRPENR